MMKITLIALLIALVYSFPCEENPELFTQRYANSYNNRDWSDFATCLAKDAYIGGANSPLFQSREQFVDACISLHPTGTRLSEFGIKFQQSSETTGTLTGFYGYYMEGEEQTLVEIGYFVGFIQKNENGLWQYSRGLFNRVDGKYSISPEFWRKNM